MIPENLRIIITDDDLDDQSLLTDALVVNGIRREMIFLITYREELSKAIQEHAKFPSILFLDLNMQKKNGLKVIEEIKADPNLKHVPILIFTTSTSPTDISSCYALGANTYFTKPFSYSELISLVEVIKVYWIDKGILRL
jgi:CheY-like chemotaxis protein